jgi:hypothetical protein
LIGALYELKYHTRLATPFLKDVDHCGIKERKCKKGKSD